MILAILLIAISIGSLYGMSYAMDPPPLNNEPITVYYSKDDEVIGEEKNRGNSQAVSLNDISPHVIHATLAVEDKNFYEHIGFDFKRIGGAIIKDIKNMSLKEGASTLTQQYARNLYLSHEKTWTRKLKEAFYTVRLEMHYSKEDILTGYLNMAYYGHGAYGIESASQYYFNKKADELSIAEAAMLSGIPKGPTYYSPFNDFDRAKKRQEFILESMYNEEMITNTEYHDALSEKLQFANETEQREHITGPHFQDVVLQEAAQVLDTDIESIRSSGLNIYTTLDKEKQLLLEEEVESKIDPETEIEVGAIAMDPFTGNIEAMVGGRNYKESSFNRAVSAKRMPGSTFKPLLYYQALENGFQPNTMLESKPTSFEWANGKVYEPSNFNGYYAEKPITLAQAIALSDNIYAVKTHMHLEPEQLIHISKKLGIESELPAYPSLALGSAEVSLQEMVNSYGTFANGGRKVNEQTIRKITDENGDILYEQDQKRGQQILDRQKAFILTSLMQGMFDRDLDNYMSVTGATIADRLTTEYAGKSGSTNVDSWMIGYSPTLVTGVWIGYDDNREISDVEEMGYAKEIWSDFMENSRNETDEEVTEFQVPAGLVPVEIDLHSGKRASPYCTDTITMYFERRHVPQDVCTGHIHGEEFKLEFDEEEELEKLEELKKDLDDLEKETRETEDNDLLERWRDWFSS